MSGVYTGELMVTPQMPLPPWWRAKKSRRPIVALAIIAMNALMSALAPPSLLLDSGLQTLTSACGSLSPERDEQTSQGVCDLPRREALGEQVDNERLKCRVA